MTHSLVERAPWQSAGWEAKFFLRFTGSAQNAACCYLSHRRIRCSPAGEPDLPWTNLLIQSRKLLVICVVSL